MWVVRLRLRRGELMLVTGIIKDCPLHLTNQRFIWHNHSLRLTVKSFAPRRSLACARCPAAEQYRV
jgi:hypothetical protein